MFNAGIDKIKLRLNPDYLNPNNTERNIRTDNALTLHKAGDNTFLAIHSEYIYPYFDIKFFIAKAVLELIKYKIIVLSDNQMITPMFVIQHLEMFFLGVSQIEFYFDFLEGKVSVDQNAVENGDIILFTGEGGIPTYYSNDYIPEKRKSSVIVYNKRMKYLHDRRYSYRQIEEMNVEHRIEIRLNRENCPYLSFSNLSGTYEDIFKRYKAFLAILYFNYMYNFVDVKGKSNTYFTRMEKKAEEEKTKYFNNKGTLKKSEPIQSNPY